MKKIDEKELHDLFNGFKERNQSSYNQLYEKYFKLVYGIAFSVMKNKEDSEDIANEVFTKIYKLDKEKLPVSNEASWLFTVTRNECFSYLRKSRQNISIDEIYEVPSKSKEIEEIIDSEYYNKLIAGLSEQEKTIISLKVLSDFTFSKIAQIMNLPIGTVQWKYYKAINSLKVSIGGLVGAAIAFMLVVLRKDKISKETPYANKENKENESYKNSNINESAKTSENMDAASAKKEETINSGEEATANVPEQNGEITNNTIEGTTYNTVVQQDSNIARDNHKIDTCSAVGITIGIIFLIIFVIFFKKYQQKFLKKKSK